MTNLIPERHGFANLPDGSRYELWSCPDTKHARYKVIYFASNGVELNSVPFDRAIPARDEFERRVQAKMSK